MKTFIFHEKNGSGILTVSKETEKEALRYVYATVLNDEEWRLDSVEEENAEPEEKCEDTVE